MSLGENSSQETLQKVDLSQNLQDQGIQLSPREQESFQKYLDSLKEEEKQSIIFLSQQELSQLKELINNQMALSQDNQIFQHVGQEKLTSFLETQKAEGISLSDMLENSNLNPEILATLPEVQSQAQEILFGNDGILTQAELSDSAQNSLATSLSLASLSELSQMDIAELKLTFQETGSIDIASLTGLLTPLVEANLTAEDFPEAGNMNLLAKDLSEGQTFFEKIMRGELDAESIKTSITEKNLSPEEIQSRDIGLTWARISGEESIQRLFEKYSALNEGNTDNENPDTSSETNTVETGLQDTIDEDQTIVDASSETLPEEEKDFIESLIEKGPLASILGLILQSFKGFAEIGREFAQNLQGENNDSESPENLVIADRPKENPLRMFQNIDSQRFGSLNGKEIQELLITDSKYRNTITEILENTDPNKTADQTLTELFGEDTKFANFAQTLKESGFLALNSNGNVSPREQFQEVLEEYRDYRVSVNALHEGEKTSWKEYAQTQSWKNPE